MNNPCCLKRFLWGGRHSLGRRRWRWTQSIFENSLKSRVTFVLLTRPPKTKIMLICCVKNVWCAATNPETRWVIRNPSPPWRDYFKRLLELKNLKEDRLSAGFFQSGFNNILFSALMFLCGEEAAVGGSLVNEYPSSSTKPPHESVGEETERITPLRTPFVFVWEIEPVHEEQGYPLPQPASVTNPLRTYTRHADTFSALLFYVAEALNHFIKPALLRENVKKCKQWHNHLSSKSTLVCNNEGCKMIQWSDNVVPEINN